MRAHPGHVGVGEDGHTIGAELHHLLQGALEGLQPLLGQAEDQVEVDPGVAEPARVFIEPAGLLQGLDPPHVALDLLGEVLDPHADPVEAELAEQGQLARGGHHGIDLQRHLGVGEHLEPRGHLGPEPLQLILGQEGGGAATQVELAQASAMGQMGADQVQLLRQDLDVTIRALLPPGHHHVAAAVGAHLTAEGDVDVERERLISAQGVGPRQVLGVGLWPHVGAPLRGRGVAGVAGARA